MHLSFQLLSRCSSCKQRTLGRDAAVPTPDKNQHLLISRRPSSVCHGLSCSRGHVSVGFTDRPPTVNFSEYFRPFISHLERTDLSSVLEIPDDLPINDLSVISKACPKICNKPSKASSPWMPQKWPDMEERFILWWEQMWPWWSWWFPAFMSGSLISDLGVFGGALLNFWSAVFCLSPISSCMLKLYLEPC